MSDASRRAAASGTDLPDFRAAANPAGMTIASAPLRPIAFDRDLDPRDRVLLQVSGIQVDVLTGIYSEETHLPQPLRIAVEAELCAPERFEHDTALTASKNYMDLRDAVTQALPRDVHFALIEAVAEHVADTILLQDDRIIRVSVSIVKLAISQSGESIGMSLTRHRR
jgi:dihydroneopterin aldolase